MSSNLNNLKNLNDMKITFRKETFLDAMSPMMGAISTKNTIPVLEGIMIETVEDGLRLTTYDMNKGMRLTVSDNVSIEKEGSAIIPANRLMQYLKAMPAESDVTLEVTPDSSVLISSGTSSFTMFSFKGTDYPLLPELSGDRGFNVSGGMMKKIINKVLHSVAVQDSTRPMLCGAFFRLCPGEMEVVSCDSFTLSRCRTKCDLVDNGRIATAQHEFIIPGHALNELVRLLPDGDEVITVEMTRKHAFYHLPNMIFFTRTIDSDYIDYERILPKDQTIFVTCDRERLLDGLERAGIIAEERIVGSVKSHVKVSVDGNILRLTSSTVNGKVFDELPCTHEGEDLEIAFNCRYLINSVRAADSEKIRITMKSQKQSITIEPFIKEEDHDFFYMILPVKIYGT